MVNTHEKGDENEPMTAWDTFMIVIVGILLPSWDVYSDVALSIKLLTSGNPDAANFGWLMQVPILLSTVLLIPHWLTMEKSSLKRRLVTFPLLVLQFWPQSRMIRLLYFGRWKTVQFPHGRPKAYHEAHCRPSKASFQRAKPKNW